jgi:ParB-like chromosome segregation protein Spo0J
MSKQNRNVNGSLKPLLMPVGTLKLDPNNARKHSERSVESIKASLLAFGQQKPIVCTKDRTVIAGNGLLTAARELGWEEVACVVLDTDDAAKARAFALADNRTAELSEWDFEQVSATLKELQAEHFPIDTLGWLDFELAPLLNANFEPPAIEESDDNAEPREAVRPIKLTAEQREVFERALAKVREREDDASMTEGRCVELLSAEYLS